MSEVYKEQLEQLMKSTEDLKQQEVTRIINQTAKGLVVVPKDCIRDFNMLVKAQENIEKEIKRLGEEK